MKRAEYAYVVTFVSLMGALFCVLYLVLDG
jgi:hypothetical protein